VADHEHRAGLRTRPASAGGEDDPTNPQRPYPASKVAAEQALHECGLTWTILRLGFVYGDQNGRLQTAPELLGSWNWHPAHTWTAPGPASWATGPPSPPCTRQPTTARYSHDSCRSPQSPTHNRICRKWAFTTYDAMSRRPSIPTSRPAVCCSAWHHSWGYARHLAAREGDGRPRRTVRLSSGRGAAACDLVRIDHFRGFAAA